MESAAVPRPLVKRHHGLVRLAHWLNAIVLLGMIASGLQIYGAFSHFGIRGEPFPLPNPLDGTPSPNGAGSAAGSQEGSTGILRSPGHL